MHIYICLEDILRILYYFKNIQTGRRDEIGWHGDLKKRMLIKKEEEKKAWMTGNEGENTVSEKLKNSTEPGIPQDKGEIWKINIFFYSQKTLHSLIIS